MLARRLVILIQLNEATMNQVISRKDFKKQVIEGLKLTLVKFEIEWSGACQIISPLYDELAKVYQDKVNFFKVDAEQESGMKKEYGILEYPTILFFQNGEVIDHTKGLIPKNLLVSKIEAALQIH